MALPPFDALTAALDAWLGQHIPNATRRARVRRSVDCLDDLRLAPLAHIRAVFDASLYLRRRAGATTIFRSVHEKPIAGVAHAFEVYAHLRNPRSPIDNRPPARMDRGHALDGAPGARGPSELPTLITATAEDLESISPLVRKTGRALSSLPLVRITLSLHRES